MTKAMAATNIRHANRINSYACSSIALLSAIIKTIMFPKDTVRSQKLVRTDFMLGGA